MQGREEPANCLDPVEAIEIERNDSDSQRAAATGAVEDLEMLAVAKGDAEIRAGGVRRKVDTPDRRSSGDAFTEPRRGLGQHDNAGILLWKPEDRSVRRWDQGIDREIAIPTAAEFARSAVRGLHG